MDIDNQVTQEGVDNPVEAPQDQDLAQEQDVPRGTSEQEVEKPYVPFANGKEKFKVNGKEEEWDWETAKKYASLGKSAYQKMEEAAQIKKSSEAAYKQLLELAEKDPESLIKALNPNYGAQPRMRQQEDVTDQDPVKLELKQTREELDQIKAALEAQSVEAELKMINSELDEATTKYPVLKGDKFALNYVKQEYAKALRAGHDVSIDDVAFLVAQEIQESKKQASQQVKQRLDEKRKKAPVSVVASGSESKAKPMDLEAVKKLAGLS